MPYEFSCPNGHALEGDESLVGRVCECPHCGVRMKVPPAPVERLPQIRVPGRESEYRESRWQSPDTDLTVSPIQGPVEPDTFHIPCPNGHFLEVLPEMLGKAAMCPECEAKFKLDRRDSVEFKRQEEDRTAKADRALSRRWLHASIVAVVLTLLGLVLMFALV